jgi:DNA replication protein DnaC
MTDLNRLKDTLTTLRLKGMAGQLDPVMEQAKQANLDPLTSLHRLVDLELEQRWHSAIVQRWRQSALRDKRTIAQFDFDHHASRKEQTTRILELLNLAFVLAHREVICIGNPGTGTTFWATCLAYAACNANIKVLFTTAMDMLNQLIAAEADHSLLQKLHHYHAPDLLVVDELGSLSLG